MLRVETYLAQSALNGIGLFINQFAARGTVLWAFDPGLDPAMPLEEVRRRVAGDEVLAHFVRHYAYVDIASPQFVTFNADNERFKNDSTAPNCVVGAAGESIAARDIFPGEELTNNYEDFLLDSEIAIAITWRRRLG
jgi:hypothetical protein